MSSADLKSIGHRWTVMAVVLVAVVQCQQVMGWSTEDKFEGSAADDMLWNEMSQRHVRSPKSGIPKYDPGLMFIGLGKRHDSPPLVAPHAMFNARKFFDGLFLRQLNRMRPHRRAIDDEGDDDDVWRQEAVRSAAGDVRSTRSKSVKSQYDPSLLWTGLGR